MATIEHLQERVYVPDRENFKSLVQTKNSLRALIIFVAIIGIICTIVYIVKPSFAIDYGMKASLILLLCAVGAIIMGRDKNTNINENITPNTPDKKYLLSLGTEVKKFYGSASKTSKAEGNLIRPLLLDAEKIKRHGLIMATVGAGKTVLMKGLVEQQAILGGGGLVIDGKGTAEFAKEIFGLFASIGREDDFIHINFLDMNNTHTLNPLLAGNALALYEILISLLIGEENEWKEKQKEFMKSILKLLVWKRDNEGLRLDFGVLAVYLTLDRLVREALNYRHLAYKFTVIEDFVQFVSGSIGFDYNDFIKGSGDEFEKEVKENGRNTKLQGVYDASMSAQAWRGVITNLKSDYGRVFNTQYPTISMWEAVQRNKFIFVTLPTMASDTTPKELGRLILGLIKGVAAEKAEKAVEPEIPFLVLADEIGSYIIEGFGRLMSKSRALGISVWPIFQSPAQIDQVGKIVGSESLERREIIDVTGTHILMKNIHPETTDFYARMLKETKFIDTDYTEKRKNAKGPISAEKHFKIEKEAAIKHDEVIGMNSGEMMVITDGKLYRAIAVTETSLAKEGKKTTYKGKNLEAKIPLTEYMPKTVFLGIMQEAVKWKI
ncbi:MAG: TraM recognition domain-containing protein [Campylobacteraceae bacterium]|jgi:intracellular multiplication protein IcmO|nr:TraM recognition domain-containing protein [Campylobacteraceae bacterium]